MKTSIRMAASTNGVALLFVLVSGVITVLNELVPAASGFLHPLVRFAQPILWLALLVVFVTGFHIAFQEAVQRIQQRENLHDERDKGV